MNKEKVLKQLKAKLPGVDHVFGFIRYSDWEKAGSPYTWVKSHEIEKGRVCLLIDQSRGQMALVVDDKVQDTGKDFVRSNNRKFVGLSEYYLESKCSLYKVADPQIVIKFEKVKLPGGSK
jgi:hypothetical protein